MSRDHRWYAIVGISDLDFMFFHQITEWFSILFRGLDLSELCAVLKNLFSYSLSRVCIDRIKYKAHRAAHECPGPRHKSEISSIFRVPFLGRYLDISYHFLVDFRFLLQTLFGTGTIL